MGVGDTFHPTPVGVFFGGPAGRGREVDDPYFGGAGPQRTGCIDCGECMTGCRHNAKNTLVKNYLYLAEKNGAVVHPLTTVTPVGRCDGGGYAVDAPWTKAKLSRKTARKTFTAEQVDLRRRRARHPEAAAPAQGRRRPAAALRPARRADPDQLRVAARRHRAKGPRRRLQPRRRDHLVVAPRRASPTSSRSATARAATRCRCCRPC